MSKGKVAIVGSGLIGSCWATLFASADYAVIMYDISLDQLERAKENVKRNLDKLSEQGLLRGDKPVLLAYESVSVTTSLKEALEGAIYVQESTLESADHKKRIFQEMDEFAGENTILASSTSTIPASQFTEELRHRKNCLVVHPVNPPLYLPLTELIPAPWTSSETVEKARDIMKSIGQEPVCLKKEVVGFAVNRIQFALLAEAWRLVSDNVLSPEDVDKVMSAGLGPRYAFNGPFETIHMNANGVLDYCDRYMAGVKRVLADFGPNPTFEETHALKEIDASLIKDMPLDKLNEHKTERERKLAALMRLKKL